jgi:hypothetical protein
MADAELPAVTSLLRLDAPEAQVTSEPAPPLQQPAPDAH